MDLSSQYVCCSKLAAELFQLTGIPLKEQYTRSTKSSGTIPARGGATDKYDQQENAGVAFAK